MMFLAIAGYGIIFAQLPMIVKSDKIGSDAYYKGGDTARHTFNVTFTKWITKAPHMVGVVGGDVGDGTYTGEILKLSKAGDVTSVEALYQFHGSLHSFTAHLYVKENDAPGVGTAISTGLITKGWLKGASVSGEYKVWAICPIPTPGNGEGTKCYQGTLHILTGGKD